MSPSKPKPLPLSIDPIQKRMARAQFGALCYRVEKGMVQILLVTSRGTKRWIVPKGWPEDGLTPAEAAAKEAGEEAGVTGTVKQRPIGVYSYEKQYGKCRIPALYSDTLRAQSEKTTRQLCRTIRTPPQVVFLRGGRKPSGRTGTCTID